MLGEGRGAGKKKNNKTKLFKIVQVVDMYCQQYMYLDMLGIQVYDSQYFPSLSL